MDTGKNSEQLAGFDPAHYFASPETRVDLSQVKPHACMVDVVQIGNYVHCHTGHHGIRLKPDQILTKVGDKWVIDKLIVQNSPELPPKHKPAKV